MDKLKEKNYFLQKSLEIYFVMRYDKESKLSIGVFYGIHIARHIDAHSSGIGFRCAFWTYAWA